MNLPQYLEISLYVSPSLPSERQTLQNSSEIVQSNSQVDAKLYLSALFSVWISGTSHARVRTVAKVSPTRPKVEL
jgi:hypothetical protein